VVHKDERAERLEGGDAPEHLRADQGVRADNGFLLGGQRLGPACDVSGNREHAEVVDEGALPETLELRRRQARRPAELRREAGHARRVLDREGFTGLEDADDLREDAGEDGHLLLKERRPDHGAEARADHGIRSRPEEDVRRAGPDGGFGEGLIAWRHDRDERNARPLRVVQKGLQAPDVRVAVRKEREDNRLRRDDGRSQGRLRPRDGDDLEEGAPEGRRKLAQTRRVRLREEDDGETHGLKIAEDALSDAENDVMPPDPRRRTRVAVIDDDPGVRDLIRSALTADGIDVDAFEGAQPFLDRADLAAYDLVLCDLVMPGMTGTDLLEEVHERVPDLPFVIISGQGTVTSAVVAMKAGALDFLEKPFRIPRLLDVVHRATRPAAPEAAPLSDQPPVVGRSRAWLDLLEKARRVASLSDTILIRGETGSGKEVVARYIAAAGPRAGQPFVPVNCAAIPDSLLESELFGHVRGAFTGATAPRRGLFEEADGGTVFLDEIGTMPSAAQAKILRVLEDREIKHVGDNLTIPVDVRILVATNLDLEAAVARHAFRDDLYYRLAVITLWVPPLREREGDALVLAEYFLRRIAAAGVPPRTLSDSARALLSTYAFPGNVRELKHALAQACALYPRPELTAADFPFLSARKDLLASKATESYLQMHGPRDVTPEMLNEALKKTGGNRLEAARALQISRSSLYRLLRKLPG
jgi:two-component system response regulator GlrR